MNVKLLRLPPNKREVFRRDRQKFIPANSGCYLLTTFEGHILYVGLSRDLRRRFGQHLDAPEKTKVTPEGRAFYCYWLECENREQIERTWLQECVIEDGKRPILNKRDSPVGV